MSSYILLLVFLMVHIILTYVTFANLHESSLSHNSKSNNMQQDIIYQGKTKQNAMRKNTMIPLQIAVGEKIGSRPPLCKGKCRGCVPCNPVQVTMPPSQHGGPIAKPTLTFTQESSVYHVQGPPYYNVAWRCRCRGKDYSP